MLTIEQVMASQKTGMEALLGLTTKAFESVEKIIELNVSTSKAVLLESGEHAKALFSAKDAHELLALQSSRLQPLTEKAATYSRHLYDIASNSSAELRKALEGQAADLQQKVQELVDTAAKNAPAGSETMVAVMKNAVMATNQAVEAVQQAVRQATDVAEANFNATAATAADAAKPGTKKR